MKSETPLEVWGSPEVSRGSMEVLWEEEEEEEEEDEEEEEKGDEDEDEDEEDDDEGCEGWKRLGLGLAACASGETCWASRFGKLE